MPRLQMKTFLKILFAPVLWLFNACSPLGNPVDEKKSDSHYYNSKKTDIHYVPMGNWFELGNSPMNADIESFEVLSRFLSKDKNRGYYTQHPIAEGTLDLGTFNAKEGVYMASIGFDKNHVYLFERTYEKDQVVHPRIVKGADPKTYVAKDFNWAKDHQNHYYRHQQIEVDYHTFQNLNESFSKDQDSVYYQYLSSFKTIKADVTSFKVLDERYYAVDASHVFFNHYTGNETNTELRTLPIPTGEKVTLLNEAYLQIGPRIYYGATPIEIDAESHEIVGTYYIKDKNNVYYQDRLVADADAASFGPLDDYRIGDKNGAFRGAERYQK